MSLTKNEKIAVAKILADIAKADLIIDENERSYLLAVSDLINISTEEIRQASNLSVFAALDVIAGMTPDKKAAVGLMATTMAEIDSNLHPREYDILKVVFAALGVPID